MSPSPQEFDPIRRDLILRKIPLVIAATLLTPSVLISCDKQETKENINSPREGDLFVLNEKTYLLRNNKRYPIPNLEKYKRYTKFEPYGRKIFTSPAGSFNQLPLGEISKLPTIIDLFTGEIKKNRPFGGEINVYFSGFLTDGGNISETIRSATDSFVDIRKNLLAQGWDPSLESIFFTYGEKAIEKATAEYKAKNTARPPTENIKNALEFFQVLKEQFPPVQFNVFGHSLGAIFALEIARKHSDAINNLILINGPIRGLEASFLEKMAVKLALKPALMPFIGGIEEKVTDYLFGIWEDKDYQKKLEEFVRFFTSIGRRMTIVIDKTDPIVPEESAVVSGAEIIPLSTDNPPVISVRDLIGIGISGISEEEWMEMGKNLLQAHGRPLKDKRVIEEIGKRIGQDLADAA